MSPIKSRILIIDDHPVFLGGLAALLDLEADLNVCGKATSIDEAKEQVNADEFDLIILDLTLNGDNGIEFIRWLCDKDIDTPVLVASMHEDKVYVERALAAGARGYLTKRSSNETILEAIRLTLRGENFVDPALALQLNHNDTPDIDPVQELSEREFAVFEHIAQGHGTKEIAQSLHRSIKTVESHRASIMKKLGITSAPELVRYATIWSQQHL